MQFKCSRLRAHEARLAVGHTAKIDRAPAKRSTDNAATLVWDVVVDCAERTAVAPRRLHLAALALEKATQLVSIILAGPRAYS
jgi:hypothetical protein